MTDRNQLVRELLSGLTDEELQNLVSNRKRQRREMMPTQTVRRMPEPQRAQPIPAKRIRRAQLVAPVEKPIKIPRLRTVKNMIQYFENLGKKSLTPRPTVRNIIKKRKTLENYTESYDIRVKSNDPLVQLNNTRENISKLFGNV